ncbi:MAG: hypothetical protein JST85_18485 [Acidobacteria bacterium]|nr:hypothetical protein [Acidobacteriota bacterium]
MTNTGLQKFDDSPSSAASTESSIEPRLVVYRDPADVRTSFQLLTTLLIVLGLLVLSAVGNAYQYWRRPDRIVVDRSSGQVLMINDREYGETSAVKMMPDRPNEADKKYLVSEYTRLLYGINPATRATDLKAALEMMVPQSAARFAAYLKDQHILEQQRAESWQAVWTPQDTSIDRLDPYTLRVIGRQEITKVINNSVVRETKQLQLTVKLVSDPAGRNDANRRMGFLVAAIDYKELGS